VLQPRPIQVPVIDPTKYAYDREVPDYFLRPDLFEPEIQIPVADVPQEQREVTDFDFMSVTELRRQLRERNIPGGYKMRKQEMIDLLKKL